MTDKMTQEFAYFPLKTFEKQKYITKQNQNFD